MGNQIVSKQEEDIYVYNKIITPHYKEKNEEVPRLTVSTSAQNFNRTKVIANITFENQPFGEMLIYLLQRNAEGRINNHTFVGKAGYHISGPYKTNAVFEFNPEADCATSIEELEKLGVGLENITDSIKKHIEQLQQRIYGKTK